MGREDGHEYISARVRSTSWKQNLHSVSTSFSSSTSGAEDSGEEEPDEKPLSLLDFFPVRSESASSSNRLLFLGLGLGDDCVVTGVGNKVPGVPYVLRLFLNVDLGLAAIGTIAEGIFRPPSHIRIEIQKAASGISYLSSF